MHACVSATRWSSQNGIISVTDALIVSVCVCTVHNVLHLQPWR